MKHFNDQISARAKEFADLSPRTPRTPKTPRGEDNHRTTTHVDMDPSSVIPDDVWEAMADIDSVRKELLMQNAMGVLEQKRGSSILN